MDINKFEKINKNEYKLFLSNGNEITLYDDVILKYDLLITRKISANDITKIMDENDEKKAYYLALKKINRKMQTEYEIRSYLESKDINVRIIDSVIDELKTQNYLNDNLYTETFIKDSINLSNNGPLKIKNALIKKGIKLSVIDEHLSKIDNKIWIQKTRKLIEKKASTSRDSKYIFKAKMSRKLNTLGYLSEHFTCNFDNIKINTKNNFKEKATKEWTKLSKKYKDKELLYKFRNSMYQKGFSTDDINSFLDNIIL